MLTREVLEALATAEPRPFVVSGHARTDPRDPANTSATPAWLINLRNGLGALSERFEAGDDRATRLAFRGLRERIEGELVALGPDARGRSVSWFFDSDGTSERFSLQLPIRSDKVVSDAKPFISPLVDVADRGARTGVVLVAGDLVRLVQLEQAEATEPENSTYELALGDWRPFGGTAGGSPERGLRLTSHEERYEARVEAHQQRLYDTAARTTARRLDELGWERVVLVSERQVAARFRAALPVTIGERVIAEADLNLAGDDLSVIADAVEAVIDEAWWGRTADLIDLAHRRVRTGGAATIGAEETLGALAEGRVHQLLIDPDQDFTTAAPRVPQSIGGPPELLGERPSRRRSARPRTSPRAPLRRRRRCAMPAGWRRSSGTEPGL